MASPPLPAAQRHSGLDPDPGGISVQVSGAWPGGRLPSQVSFSRLNHGPSADDRTAESATATGYFANLPSAQLGTHWFSQSVPCPAAAEAVQSAQVRPSIRRPASAHVSTIDDGSLLSVCGSALAQSATTPTSANGADEPRPVAGAVAGLVAGPLVGLVADAAAAPVGEAATAVPVGEAVTVGVGLFLAVPPGPK